MAIRPEKGSFYDFTCGNDFRRVKLAIKSNTYHAVKISAEIAQNINFTGGLARIDEILLYKCFKLTRIMWPEDCGFINIFKIYEADSIGRLDVSPLHELEQLSIQNCQELEDLSGFPKKIKSIVVIGCKLDHLSLSHFSHLENIIIFTSAPVFTLNLDHCDALKSVSIAGRNITAKVTHCKNLKTLHIGANASKAIIDVDDCPSLAEAFIICNKQSQISGLAQCLRLNYLMLPDYEKILTDITRARLIKNIEAFNKTHHVKESIDDAIRDFNHFIDECRKSIIILLSGHSDVETIVQENSTIRESKRSCSVMILLLSLPQAYHKPELNKYYGSFMGKHIDESGTTHLPSGGMLAAAFTDFKEGGAKGIPAHFMQSSLPLNKLTQQIDHSKKNQDQLKQNMLHMKKDVMKIHHWLHEHGQEADISQNELLENLEYYKKALDTLINPEPELYESFHVGAGIADAYAPSMQNMFHPIAPASPQNTSSLRNTSEQNISQQNSMQSQTTAANQFVREPLPLPVNADPLLIPITDDQHLGKISDRARSIQSGPLKSHPSIIPYADKADVQAISDEGKAEPENPIPGVLVITKPGPKAAENTTNKSDSLKADPSIIPYADKGDMQAISDQGKAEPENPIPGVLIVTKPGPKAAENTTNKSESLKADPSLASYSDDKDLKNIADESKTEPENPIPGVLSIDEPGEIEGILSVKKPGLQAAEKTTNKSESLRVDPSLITYASDDQNLINVSIEHSTDPEKPIPGKLSINEPEEIEGVLSVNKPEEVEGVLSVNKPEEIEGVLSVNKPEEIEGVLSIDKPVKKTDFLLAARGFADAINLLADAARGVINDESSDHLLEMEHKTISLFKRQLPVRGAASSESLYAVARKLTDAVNDLREACVIEKQSDKDVIEPRIDKHE